MSGIEEDAFKQVQQAVWKYKIENSGRDPHKVTVNYDTLMQIKASPEFVNICPYVGDEAKFEDYYKTFMGVLLEVVLDQKEGIILHDYFGEIRS